jgi:hypothetical protein
MIPDNELLSEIQTDPAALGYAGAGASVIHALINAEGSASVEAWVPSPTPMPRSKGEFLNLMSTAEAAAMQDLLDGGTSEGKALRFKLGQSDGIDMSQVVNRDMVAALATAGVLSAATRDAMLRLGEVRQSRALELWGEAVSLKQIKQVLGAA